MKKQFPFYRQLDQMDCGPTCLRMIAKHHGKVYSAEYLRERSYITREGVSALGIADAAEAIGLRTLAVTINFDTLATEAPLPCIAHWRQRHFVVVHKIKGDKVWVADPAFGKIVYTKEQFLDGWLYNKKQDDPETEGLVILLEPTPDFYESEVEEKPRRKGLSFLLPYLRPFRSSLIQLFLGLLIGSVLQLIFPFLTQAVIDYGVNYQNINFIYLILIAQLMLFFSQTLVGVIRSWLLLHMGARININLISDFLIKMMKLPIAFFDSKMIGDLLQRIQDHNRIQDFLSSVSLNVVFSLFNLVIFGFILAWYNVTIFLIFVAGAVLYVSWVMFFLKKRAVLDYKRFDASAENRSSMIQLINGMQEIKLNNSEKRRRWEWENIQVRLFRISLKGLALEQSQSIGANFINELKNIIITFIAAKSVIDGDMTLGMMLAVQYILGQLNAPLNQFIQFAHTMQDAKISLERLAEIHNKDDEEQGGEKIMQLPERKAIQLEKVSFHYGSPSNPLVLKDIDLEIPEGKVTAIVGASGSGKTTLLKLLLKFYPPSQGNIRIGNVQLESISNRLWRQKCGVVMQDGFTFADTIARNITESSQDGVINREKLLQSARIANIEGFIESLPNAYNTRVSWSGIALSGGQTQRMLIARAVYKDPDFLFFDEATSALDANNEKIIMENLEEFYKGKTVVVIAHRLSTVKNADQIIVLDGGEIVERGNHEELTQLRGAYFTLVKNQLELGN